MKQLYIRLRDLFSSLGYNIAPYGENTMPTEERDMLIDIQEISEIESGFVCMRGMITLSFINQNDWEEHEKTIREAFISCIPMGDRECEEMMALPDRSNDLTILSVPFFSDITAEMDEETASETQSATIEFYFQF